MDLGEEESILNYVKEQEARGFSFEAADADFFAGVDAEANELGTRIRQSCLTMPDPQPLTIFDNVYAEPSPQLDYERERFAAYLDSFAEPAP